MFEDINFKDPENAPEIRRPFVVDVEESVARSFIKKCKSNGLFVRETMVKLMREFANREIEDGKIKR